MRILIYLPVLAFLLGACSGSGSRSGSGTDPGAETGTVSSAGESAGEAAGEAAGTVYTAETGFPEENLKLVHLDVKGMTCEGCEKAIVGSICKLDGIQEASASHTAAEAIVTFDSTKTSMEAIQQAIADAGYSVAGEKSPHMNH
jgi:copper chaperone